MKSNLLENSWAIPLLTAGVAAAYLFLVFLPGQKAMGQLANDLATKQDFVSQTGMMSPAMKVSEQEVKKTLEYNAAWKGAAPTEGQLSALFGQIHTLAKTSGLTTTRFDLQEPEVLARVQRVPVVIGCTGSFDQIARFLAQLERLPQTIWIEDLRIEPAGKAGEVVQCEVSLVVFADNPENSDQVNSSG